MTPDTDIAAILAVYGYGYTVTILLNGVDLGVTGGKSENQRLFNTNHSRASQMPAEMRQKYFALNEGENRIVVDFTKTDASAIALDVDVMLEGYPAPVFFLHSESKLSGRIEKTFFVHKKAPDDFKPVYVADEADTRAAYVYVARSQCTVTQTLNGKAQTLQSIGGETPLTGVVSGKNTLVITYKCASGATDDLKFAIVMPEGCKHYSRTITDAAEHTETFEFTAT
jgi:hypothetical protein